MTNLAITAVSPPLATRVSYVTETLTDVAACAFYYSLWALLQPFALIAKTIKLAEITFFRPENKVQKRIADELRILLKSKCNDLEWDTSFYELIDIIYEAELEGNIEAFVDVLAAFGKKNWKYIPELLKGGNFKFENDSGLLFDAWTKLPGARPRISSHKCMPGTSVYTLSGNFMKELLFWRDDNGDTRCQLEGHGFQGLFITPTDILHASDYLLYKATKHQMGPFGRSVHTDKNPRAVQFTWYGYNINRISINTKLGVYPSPNEFFTNSTGVVVVAITSLAIGIFTHCLANGFSL